MNVAKPDKHKYIPISNLGFLSNAITVFWIMVFLVIFAIAPKLVFSKGNTFNFEQFGQSNGLVNNQVHCVFQDRRGFMWFGTSQGASRFDGYKFTTFENRPGDSTSLRGNLVRVIFEDKKGQLFIGTEYGGLNVFDRNKENFLHPLDHISPSEFGQISVNDIIEDDQGKLWIATDKGLLTYNADGLISWIRPTETTPNQKFSGNYVRVMTFDTEGNLWMGTNNGLFVLNIQSNRVSSFKLPVPGSGNQEIWELITDIDGKIWIGTYDNGIFIINRQKLIEKQIFPDPGNDRTRTIRTISRDNSGNYWIGTRGGLFVYTLKNGITDAYYHDERLEKSLSGNSILDIFHDARGDTWIGTRSGINFLIHSKQVFQNYRAMPNDNHYLNSNEVYAFWVDPTNKIWIGTEDGGINIYNRQSRTFEYLTIRQGSNNSLSSNCIKSFMTDGQGNLWIGTFRGGVNVLNLKSQKIIHHRHNHSDPNSLSDDRVWCIFMDSRKDIWVTTSSGVDRYNPNTKSFEKLKAIPPNTQVNWINEDSEGDLWIGAYDRVLIYNSISGESRWFTENSRSFLEDSQNKYWVTTLDKGLALYSKTKGAVRYFGRNEGIANNQTLSVLEDNNRFLWISTSNGLSRLNPETGFSETFTAVDGLQNDQFNYGAAFKTNTGELIFGGISGFNIFDPLEVKTNKYAAPIVFTELRIFNKRVEIGNKKNNILQKSITETKEIALPFNQNVITFEFATVNFVNSQSNLYSYFLEGFDKSWNDPSFNRTATYTNLNPGDYKLWVKSVISGVPDSGQNASIEIRILPPFWKTWWFKILILAFIAFLLFALLRFSLNREKLKNEVVFERVKANKLHELDMLKLKFFTNVSHEIRTPLTLILGPLEKLRNPMQSPEQLSTLVEIMHRNALQLDRLITQILDFRKLEAGNLKLELNEGDLVDFVKNNVQMFENVAHDKEIELRFHTLTDQLRARFDPDKLGKILNNLLSNAFKFTEKNGKITVTLALAFDAGDAVSNEEKNNEQRFIEITVKDTGHGISRSNLDKIFIRFFQANENSEIPGTGIGLALTKELVKLHNGHISVTSKTGAGSKFTVRLPYLEANGTQRDGTKFQKSASENVLTADDLAREEAGNLLMKIMLVVEDNADVRLFVRNHFENTFHVLEAQSGNKGWEIAVKTIPDIILSDVLMGDGNGYDLCKRIKNDERTSHIPVLLLTALASKQHEIEGLAAGADDYITKPFDLAILQTKIENLLSIRQSLKQRYSGQLLLQPKNILISPPDERFLKKVIQIIEDNIANSDFDIELFSVEAGVSRMQLYRKLNALVDMTVKEFVRHIRLKRAAQLLEQKNQNISEVAYAVGFKDLSHFRKCFRQEFGMSATEYLEKHTSE